ncbi:putative DNA polymerase [Labeo rohita]|uniref:Putative DNA polymerase n=1 Tax=Labeo rohita TaxID=84645 RepID=A0A498NYG3_LABRO|nr:putative DNA polymerase [Labeo rohita]
MCDDKVEIKVDVAMNRQGGGRRRKLTEIPLQKPRKEDVQQTRDINVFIGAFMTVHAQLELYDLMDKLGDRVLYTDTDSLIFVSRDGDWMPPLGDHLGELTDEIGDDDYIMEYCSSGPK